MSELIPLVDVLSDKKGPRKEAHLILFEYCNLSCSFCHQDHDSTKGMDVESIVDKARILISHSASNLPIVVNITGGELFLDEIPDEFFEAYYKAAKLVLDYFDDAKITFGTNLVYKKIERVENLINRLQEHGNVGISSSYDPAGRFRKGDRETFFANLEKVSDKVKAVTVVITKQNIRDILDGKEDDVLKWMCEKYPVIFDHYIPSERYEKIQPTEEMVGKLYLYLNENHPNSSPISEWKENIFNETTCRSTKIVNKDGVVTSCWSEAGKDAILDEGLGLKAKNEAELRFLEKYDCFSCDYYSRCGLRCFLHHSFIEGEKTSCSIREVFDKIL